MSERDYYGRMLVVAELIRMHGPERAAELIREVNTARAEGRLPNPDVPLPGFRFEDTEREE